MVEFAEFLRAFPSPPEPSAACLVQGPEDTGHALVLQFEEEVGYGVDITDDVLVEGRRGVPCAVAVHSMGYPYGGPVRVELVGASGGVAPVPGEGRQSAAAVGVLGQVHTAAGIVFHPVVAGASARGVHEVEAYQGGVFARCPVHRLHIVVLRHIAVGRRHVARHDARYGLGAEVLVEEGIHEPGGIGGFRVDRCGGDIESERGIVALYPHIVDVVPCPIGCYGQRVAALFHVEHAHLHLAVAVEAELGACFIHTAVHHFLAAYAVAGYIDQVLAAFIQIHSHGEARIVFGHAHGLPARVHIVGHHFAVAHLCVLRFYLVLGRRSAAQAEQRSRHHQFMHSYSTVLCEK